MRDYTRLPDEELCKMLKEYAKGHNDKGGDLCFSAAIRLRSYVDKIREMEREEDDGK